VSDPEVHDQVLSRVNEAGGRLGLRLVGQMPSPIEGKKSGNREYLALWRRDGDVTAAAVSAPA
jgi:predicted rRNA methylase YqxC with S4 and FtsJ domains